MRARAFALAVGVASFAAQVIVPAFPTWLAWVLFVVAVVYLVADGLSPGRAGLLDRLRWWNDRRHFEPLNKGWEARRYAVGTGVHLEVESITTPAQTEAAFLCIVHGPAGEFFYDERDDPLLGLGGTDVLPNREVSQAAAKFPEMFHPKPGWELPDSRDLPMGRYHVQWWAYRSTGELGLTIQPIPIAATSFKSERAK